MRLCGFVPDSVRPTDHHIGAYIALDEKADAPIWSLDDSFIDVRPQSGNSCTGFGSAACVQVAYWAQRRLRIETRSARAPYFWGRARAGLLGQDRGCPMREVLASGMKFGWPSEQDCPSQPEMMDLAPGFLAYHNASDVGRGMRGYGRVDVTNEAELRATLRHAPVLAGFPIDEATEAYQGGVLEAPTGPILGYHAIALLGWYDDGTFRARNYSWLGWGVSGYARMTWNTVCGAIDPWAFAV